MGKKVIRLTESQLQKVIRESVESILAEDEKSERRKTAEENPRIKDLKQQIQDLEKEKRESEDTYTAPLDNQIQNLKNQIETEYKKYKVNSKYIKDSEN